MLVDFHVGHNIRLLAAIATGGGGGGWEGAVEHDVSAWRFLLAVWRAEADDGGVDDGGVFEEGGFEFGGGDLPAANFDYFLL